MKTICLAKRVAVEMKGYDVFKLIKKALYTTNVSYVLFLKEKYSTNLVLLGNHDI